MLNREVIKDFLIAEFEDFTEIPDDINLDILAGDFADYVESDYYEWLRDNFKSYFFSNGVDGFSWDDVRERIKDFKPPPRV